MKISTSTSTSSLSSSRRRLLLLLLVVAVDSLRCYSLSLEDSSSSVPFSKRRGRRRRQQQQNLQQQQQQHQQQTIDLQRKSMPGIWKLTTDALPYELDIRSKLDRQFSSASKGSSSDDEARDEARDDRDSPRDTGGETILLKLNQDGTFKQYDEGYREGRWVTGRWKVCWGDRETDTTTVSNSDDSNSNPNPNPNRETDSLMLLLAMNRQYFGPPFDVLLDAIGTISYNSSSSSNKNKNKYEYNSNSNTTSRDKVIGGESTPSRGTEDDSNSDPSLKRWRGMVRRGKFLRPAPGTHPLDAPSTTATNILVDQESLGPFSLEQALAAHSIGNGRTSRRRPTKGGSGGTGATSDGSRSKNSDSEDAASGFPTEEDSGGTFFSPTSSPEDGILQ